MITFVYSSRTRREGRADCHTALRILQVIAALLAAANEHANVITASIGRASGWLDTDPDQLVMERLVTQENIVITVSVGNGRAVGPFFTLAPASTMGVISVGAVNAEQVPAFPAQVTSFGTLLYLASKPLNTSSLPASDKGYGVYFTNASSTVTNDACEALPAETPDLSVLITVIRRGGCPINTKARPLLRLLSTMRLTLSSQLLNVASKGGHVHLLRSRRTRARQLMHLNHSKIVLMYNSPDALGLTSDLPIVDTRLAEAVSMRYEDGAKVHTSPPFQRGLQQVH